jgi:predicted transcriptional regulator
VEKDGGKILGHVFGKRRKNIQNALSKQSGVSNNSVAKVLKIAAPVVLGILGKQKRNSSVNYTKDLSKMIGKLLKSQSKKQSFFEAILDADDNGSIVNELAGSILKKNISGIGNLLSKLFNKK